MERNFSPFGKRINTDIYDETNRDQEEDDSGFTGKDWDEDAGLYYYNARWYDPEIGRLISKDSSTGTWFVYDDLYRVLQKNLQNGSRMQSLF